MKVPYEGDVTYSLNQPIQFQHKGENLEASSLVLKPPSAINKVDCYKVVGFSKKAQTKTISELGEVALALMDKREELKKAGKLEPEKEEKQSILDSLVLGAGGVESVVETVVSILCNGGAYLDGKEPITKSHFAKLDFNQELDLVETYLDNFFKHIS